jgi:hypothetical protein
LRRVLIFRKEGGFSRAGKMFPLGAIRINAGSFGAARAHAQKAGSETLRDSLRRTPVWLFPHRHLPPGHTWRGVFIATALKDSPFAVTKAVLGQLVVGWFLQAMTNVI